MEQVSTIFFCDLPPPVLGVRREISQNRAFAGPVVALFCSLRTSIGDGRLWAWQCLVKRLAPECAVVGLIQVRHALESARSGTDHRQQQKMNNL